MIITSTLLLTDRILKDKINTASHCSRRTGIKSFRYFTSFYLSLQHHTRYQITVDSYAVPFPQFRHSQLSNLRARRAVKVRLHTRSRSLGRRLDLMSYDSGRQLRLITVFEKYGLSGRRDSDPLASSPCSSSSSSSSSCTSAPPLPDVLCSCCCCSCSSWSRAFPPETSSSGEAAGESGDSKGDTVIWEVASEEDRLCGADRHLISRRAFFGGVAVASGSKTFAFSPCRAASSSSSSLSSPSSSLFDTLTPVMSSGCGEGLTGSGFCCWYPPLSPDRTRDHLGHNDRRPPLPLPPPPRPVGLFRTGNRPQSRDLWRHRHGIRDDLLLVFLG
ncbi:hypothetical protein C4D60_Mb10t24190 [Musa balbisiana]|uniref:Uncharacterized protein n=1 Tax=Musa balbisiana TaxID=52838 RepID=A0A4S8J1X1_MUSBA|nr:hypothetical protein C4D60_Mb10t24190 [Musa balbisiana]